MESTTSAEEPDIYPGPLEFPACDIASSSSASACLVCLAPVEELTNHTRLLRHSGVPLLTRLQQLLPLSLTESLAPVCATCVGLLVGIDELERQLSEQHGQLQKRHVQKVEQQHWQRAAEQVICSAGQEGDCSSGQESHGSSEQRDVSGDVPGLGEQQEELIQEVPSGDDQKTGTGLKLGVHPEASQRGEESVDLDSEEDSAEEDGRLEGQHEERQDDEMCETQGDGMEQADEPVQRSAEELTASATESLQTFNPDTGLLFSNCLTL